MKLENSQTSKVREFRHVNALCNYVERAAKHRPINYEIKHWSTQACKNDTLDFRSRVPAVDHQLEIEAVHAGEGQAALYTCS